jgi:hypothetical protein
MNFVVESYPPLVPQAIDQSYFAGSKMMVDLPPSDPLYANITAFRKKYSEMRGASAKPNGNTITVPDILLMVQKVTQGMGAKVLDPEALRTAIESAHDIPELQGIWNLSPAIHVLVTPPRRKDVDARAGRGHDEAGARLDQKSLRRR